MRRDGVPEFLRTENAAHRKDRRKKRERNHKMAGNGMTGSEMTENGISASALAERKKELRKMRIRSRMEIPASRRALCSHFICEELRSRYDAALVCSYASFRGEADLEEYHRYLLERGTPLLLPRVEGREGKMVFYEIASLDDLLVSPMGIPEPNPEVCKPRSYQEIWEGNPLVLTPGVAFTASGGRMGYGGGFYDRFFEQSNGRGTKVGIAFREQMAEELPLEPHDAYVDEVVYFPRKAVLGLSGGVDSAVAARLLQEKGYEPIGVWLKMWSEDMLFGEVSRATEVASASEVQGALEVSREEEDAREVARKLGIPFLSCDLSEEFRKVVVGYFASEYAMGRTPNPCAYCNRTMKIARLIDIADREGAERIATGHYADIVKNVSGGRYEIRMPSDEKKDQGYMLSRLTQRQLSRLITPLSKTGDKAAVRAIADQAGIHVFDKKDSQEICFVDRDYQNLLHRLGVSGKKGSFFLDGARIRAHDGIEKYTIGQRKGLGAFGKSVYVLDIDPDSGDIAVGENERLFSKEVWIDDLNYVGLSEAQGQAHMREKGLEGFAKIRYAAPKERCVFYPQEDGTAKLVFSVAQRAVTPGQVAVLYDAAGSILLSGMIMRKRKEGKAQ